MDSANLRTPLYDLHVAADGRMVPFGGWDMPVQYPSGIIAEVRAVRTGAGIFDVSHMGRVYISGPSATDFLDWVVTGSAATLEIGRARYCMICNARGGVIDDTIFYRLAEDRYLLIPNAGNRHRVLDWFGLVIGQKFPGRVTLDDQTMQTSLLACQGPAALGLAAELAENGLQGCVHSLGRRQLCAAPRSSWAAPGTRGRTAWRSSRQPRPRPTSGAL